MGALIQLDDGRDIGKLFFKRRVESMVINREGINGSLAADLDPFGFSGIAGGTDDGGRPAHMVAAKTFLEAQLMLFASQNGWVSALGRGKGLL